MAIESKGKYVYEGSHTSHSDGAYDVYLSVDDRIQGERWGRCHRPRVNPKVWVCSSAEKDAFGSDRFAGIGSSRDAAMDDALKLD